MNNFEVSGVLKGIKIAAIVILVAFLGLSSFYTVNEQEQAVVMTFGAATAVKGSGPHFKIPFIQNVKKVDTTIKGFAIGYEQETKESIATESVMITSDFNFVDIDFYVESKVSDPIKFLYASNKPYDILKNIAQGCIRTVVGGYDVDSVITTSKSEIQAEIKEMILEKLEKQDIGLQLVNITIQDAEPPTDSVISAFKEVENAKQSMDTVINTAEKYKSETLLKAEAQADSIVQAAEATKNARIEEASGQVARFNEMYNEYKNFPEVTKTRMFYETMQEVLPGLKIIIDGTNQTDTILPLDSFTGEKEKAGKTEKTEEGKENDGKEDKKDVSKED